MLLLSTMMVPGQVTMIPQYLMIQKMGLFNTLWALIVPNLISAFGIYLSRQFIADIPDSLCEAAKIDGANSWRIYWHVILPNIKPAIGALGIFTALGIWNDYLSPLIMLNDIDFWTKQKYTIITLYTRCKEAVMALTDNLGKKVRLMVVKEVEFGVYLGNSQEKVLLPKKQVPRGIEIGDPVEVFLYKDSSDRLIATTSEPKITLGELTVLRVVDTGRIGAFLDWGLEKDLLLPFREQTAKIKKGDEVLVALYIDKSGRLCATMKVYDKLQSDSPYQKDDQVEGTVYEISDNFGVFVAVDNRYSALIPKREAFGKLRVGDHVHARVVKVKEDGKLDLSVREKAFLQMDADADLIMKRMEAYGGSLPFTDKAEPELIKKEFGLSKNAFKRAVGRLLKEGKIQISEKHIEIRKK